VADELPGWTSVGGMLEPDERVAGYAARRQVVKGICRAKGCFRRVALEPATLCGLGLGLIAMRQVERLWKCQRFDGCGLDFHSEPAGRPLRLEHLVGRPHVRLRVRCRMGACRFFRVFRTEEMIAGLRKRRQGDERTEVAALGAMMTSACPTCGKVSWAAEVLWQRTDSVAWKQQGERVFGPVSSSGGIGPR